MLININTKKLLKDLKDNLLSLYDNNINIANKISKRIISLSLNIKDLELITKEEISVNQDQLNKLNDNIYKHINQKIPLQYIEGSTEFLSLKILVEPPVLIPRQETEYWVYNLIEKLKVLKNKNLNILDLCTGTGCIALAFAKEFKESTVYAIDISEKAYNIAIKNAKNNNIKNIIIAQSDLYDKVNKNLKFDLIISNPPYISNKQFENLDPMVKNWEDPNALVAKDNGLEIIKKIIYNSKNFLRLNKEFTINKLPQLVLEIDYTQANRVKKILLDKQFNKVEIIKDLNEKDRVVYAIF